MTRSAPRIPGPGTQNPSPTTYGHGTGPLPAAAPAPRGKAPADRTGDRSPGTAAGSERPTGRTADRSRGGGTAAGRHADRLRGGNATTDRVTVAAPRAGRPVRPARDTSTGPGSHRRALRERAGGALAAGDCLAVLAGAMAAQAVAGAATAGDAARCGAVALGILLLGCRQAGLYRPGFDPGALREVPAVAVRAALAWGFAAAVTGAGLGREALVTAIVLTVTVACALRALTYRLRRAAALRHPGSTLIVGAGPAVRQIAAALQTHPEYGMRPVGVVAPGPGTDATDPAVRQLAAEVPLPVLAGHGQTIRAVIQNAVRYAVVTGPPALDARTTATVRLLVAQGCQVWQLSTGRGPVPPGHLWGFACRRLEPDPRGVPQAPGRRAKRALDAVVSGIALLCFAPVLGACALAVRLADGPGVLFRQERIGLGGRPFTLLKFRTLRPSDESESATRWSIAHDRRMSAVGRVLRQTSLDELPQLWNVLRGDMSLVGPRPERPHFVAQFSTAHPGYQDRHRMPAGITGLAQVHGLRGDTSIADRARFDNHYIDSWSFWQDVAILARTVCAVFRFGGS
ncbi:sugar transferase [Streptomyces sp. NBC_01476]|uniref:sugar transferase n=1 Tax=Streptomyces sp. NBC_01476 TaxID=2903881 RepID=UPI002E2EAD09|nr:sugar transferase [Streptomyces sp. NBC_01476]